jgi:hypothetical protein
MRHQKSEEIFDTHTAVPTNNSFLFAPVNHNRHPTNPKFNPAITPNLASEPLTFISVEMGSTGTTAATNPVMHNAIPNTTSSLTTKSPNRSSTLLHLSGTNISTNGIAYRDMIRENASLATRGFNTTRSQRGCLPRAQCPRHRNLDP